MLMTWNRPRHLSEDEAHNWIRDEVERFARLPDIESVTLTRVVPTDGHVSSWDWVCELHPRDGIPAVALLKHPLFDEWLHELRQLGMRPAMAVLGTTETLAPFLDAPTAKGEAF